MAFDRQLLALVALAALVVGMLLRGRVALAGSTMMAPWWWCLVSVFAIVLAEGSIAFAATTQNPAWASTARYVAAIGTLCPIMAVLGAKRPQDRGWQWVVLTLWIVLCMPAAHALATRTETHFQLHFAWKMLLMGLIVMQTINYVAWRTLPVALLVALAQLILLAPYIFSLIGFGTGNGIINGIIGMVCLVLAANVHSLTHRRMGPECFGHGTYTIRLWHRFRRLYGTFWAFRVMGLINQTAEAANWPVMLLPDGFYYRSGQHDAKPATDLPPELEQEIHQSLRNTLRRFLSERELDHLPTDGNSGQLSAVSIQQKTG